MATSLLAAKSFPGIRVYTPGDPKMPKNPINFGLTRKSPRCAQCLKFQANDPSKAQCEISVAYASKEMMRGPY